MFFMLLIIRGRAIHAQKWKFLERSLGASIIRPKRRQISFLNWRCEVGNPRLLSPRRFLISSSEMNRKMCRSIVWILAVVALAPDVYSENGAIAPGDWPSHARDAAATRYSPLDAINKKNVAGLQRAWVYHTGDIITSQGRKSQNVFECTPLVVEGKMFIITPFSRAVALDPATGKEIWNFDPKMDVGASGMLASRGVAYWHEGEQSRILLPVRDGRIYSLDAKTGKPDGSFGMNGAVNIRELYPAAAKDITLSSPPIMCGDLLVQGFSMSDSWNKVAVAPVTAFDVRSGKVVWTFDTVPQEGEFGTETWGNDSWRGRGGANVWSTMSYDAALGIVYLPATAPNFDFYGGDRHGANLLSNCVVALDAKSGKRIWHYQTTHHDLWDYDLPAAPVLVDITVDGKKIRALAQISKTGFTYVLNRETGEPVWPIPERPVPASDVSGELASPTQPVPTRPPAFTTQGLTEAGLTKISPEAHARAVELLGKLRNDGMFTPPSLKGSVVFPGFHGGGNWSGAAFDPRSARLYVNSTEVACSVKLEANPKSPFGYSHTGWIRPRDQEGYPINAPPWGQLTAIDLNKGEIAWQKPLGAFEELTRRGIPPTGQENFGGATVTAGGLVFIASTMDENLRAFDSDTGEILFKAKLDAAGYAAPVSYAVDGKQFIAICAGGGGKLGTPVGDSVIAFTLPAN